jgi:hypothetical protein
VAVKDIKLTNTEGPQPATSEELRKPFPQFNPFRNFVIEELVRRKNNYPTPINSPFVRFTSCKQDPVLKYAYFSMGLHGFDKSDINIFDQTYGGNRDIVGYAHDVPSGNKRLISADQLTGDALPKIVTNELSGQSQTIQAQREALKDQSNTLFAKGAHPIPGITDVSIQRKGLGTPLIATVKWTCYNRAQLEFLRHHFFLVGGYVVLEWGQNFSDKKLNKVLDFGDFDGIKTELVNSVNQGRKYIISNWITPNNGNYDFMVGFIGNFTIEINPATGIYNCSTTIYTVGEQMWGLSSFLTSVKKNISSTDNAAFKSSTFHEFYSYGKEFDELCNAALRAKQTYYVAPFNASWDKGSTENVTLTREDLTKFSVNSQDYRFVSWRFFVNEVIPQMLNVLVDENVKTDIKRFLSLTNDEWVGDNPTLISTNPDALILVKKDLVSDPAFGANGFFDSTAGAGYRGQLSKGVWLNAGMIRNAFLGTNSFQQAIQTILNSMNSSVANYWNLSLFFDEEVGGYKVIDLQHTSNLDIRPFYKFNSGTNGEVLNINFDSAFPPELITQMALFAKFKTETFPHQQDLLRQYPTIGTTSTFMFSLNWTNLEDILGTELQKQRIEVSGSSLSPADQFIASTSAKTTFLDTATSRLLNIDPATQGARTKTIDLSSGNPSVQQQGAPTQPLTTRNSVLTPNEARVKRYAAKAAPFRSSIENASAKYNVDADLIRAVIGQETGDDWDVKARREEPHINDHSVGLMQILTTTARSVANRPIEDWELQNPDTNIDLGTAYLASTIKQAGTTEAGLSAYNGGFRPLKGFGRTLPDTGLFSNQNYVNGVMRRYNIFRAASGQGPITGDTTQPNGVPNLENNTITKKDAVQSTVVKNDISKRFGDSIVKFIELSPSAMVSRITQSGYLNYPKVPNSFVCPFPTTTSVSIHILGLGGISVSDAFFVDKIPFVFEQYGAFQVTSIDEKITTQGWVTIITGYFKLIWMNGEGPLPKPIA